MAKKLENVARDLRRASNGRLKQDLATCDNSRADAGLRKMHRDDCKGALRVANHIEKGRIERALDLTSEFDTMARDAIIDDIEKTSPSFHKKYMVSRGW